ncbi:hypothetical protein H4R19_003481 [Coemansia spiralis]|nr:hypothetical protein H4R19_003481 [Coemansia spiralis]
MSAGVQAKEHHLARNGAGPRGSVKKEGGGRFNWGTEADEAREVEEIDDVGGSEKALRDDPLSRPAQTQAKVKVAGPKAFEEARKSNSP